MIETARWVTVVMGCIGLVWMTVRTIIRWKFYPYQLRLCYLLLWFYVIGITEGTYEAVTEAIVSTVSARVWLYLFTNFALLVFLALTQPHRAYSVDVTNGD